MSRILLDHNAPKPLRSRLPGHEVVTAKHLGWSNLTNGALLSAAEAAGFDVLITADQNLRFQQNLGRRRLAIIVLDTNYWPHIRLDLLTVMRAIDAARPGHVQLVTITP